MAEAERRQRRDLVPLRQAVAVFGEPFPSPRPRRRLTIGGFQRTGGILRTRPVEQTLR